VASRSVASPATRTTGDIDMFFRGGRGRYTPDFGLLHPEYLERAVNLPAHGGFPMSVLHPVDLATNKVARLHDHDRADIAALAQIKAFDAEAFARLGEESIGYAASDPVASAESASTRPGATRRG
jgi:hypothetical protein